MFCEKENAFSFFGLMGTQNDVCCLTLNVNITLFVYEKTQQGTFKTEVICNVTLTSQAQPFTPAHAHTSLI